MSCTPQKHLARCWLAAVLERHTTLFLCSRISCEDAAEGGVPAEVASPLSMPGVLTVFGECGVEERLPSLPDQEQVLATETSGTEARRRRFRAFASRTSGAETRRRRKRSEPPLVLDQAAGCPPPCVHGLGGNMLTAVCAFCSAHTCCHWKFKELNKSCSEALLIMGFISGFDSSATGTRRSPWQTFSACRSKSLGLSIKELLLVSIKPGKERLIGRQRSGSYRADPSDEGCFTSDEPLEERFMIFAAGLSK